MQVSSNPPIYTGTESLNELKQFVAAGNYSAIAVIVDENTEKYCLPFLKNIMIRIYYFTSTIFFTSLKSPAEISYR